MDENEFKFRALYLCTWRDFFRQAMMVATRMTRKPPLTAAEIALQFLTAGFLVLVVTANENISH